jgi:hypothetical protein
VIASAGFWLLRWVIGTQAGQVTALVILALALFGGWTWKVSRDADMAAVQKVLAETKEESDRRMKALTEVAKVASERSVALEKLAADRAELLGKIDALSTANDARACLDPAGVLRLDALRSRGR